MYSGAPQAGIDVRRIGVAALMLMPGGGPYRTTVGSLAMDFPPQLGAPMGLQAVPVLAAGGSTAQYVQAPSDPTSFTLRTSSSAMPGVLVLFVGSPPGRPYVLGYQTPQGVIIGGEDAPFGVNDAVVRAGGSTLILRTSTGALAATLAASSSIDVPSEGTLTVSRNGAAAGRAVSAAPLEAYAEPLSAVVLEIRNALNVLLEAATLLPITTSVPSLGDCRLSVMPISADVEGP